MSARSSTTVMDFNSVEDSVRDDSVADDSWGVMDNGVVKAFLDAEGGAAVRKAFGTALGAQKAAVSRGMRANAARAAADNAEAA
mmetsp:Transcript_24883/g.50572  ORF Transcript_24883/g.50572 Transcript_24883/m.50572 type:complete len:84 (+) Transcript_24883:574-825(+)